MQYIEVLVLLCIVPISPSPLRSRGKSSQIKKSSMIPHPVNCWKIPFERGEKKKKSWEKYAVMDNVLKYLS